MIIRPHHGMCLVFFRGRGYSAGFTAHMAQVRELLLREDPAVCLYPEADVLCACCPHNEHGACSDGEKAARYDHAVLELCALLPGQPIRWSRFARLVEERILSPGRREQICSDCQWNTFCTASSTR